MSQKSVQLVDVEVTVSFTIDPTKVTLADAQRFAAEAIAAKLDFIAERADWGDTAGQNYFYNGDCASDARLA
jgi:predicted metal-dependent TIM-barrel fold hydrolase